MGARPLCRPHRIRCNSTSENPQNNGPGFGRALFSEVQRIQIHCGKAFLTAEWLRYSTIRWCLSGYDARLFLAAVPTAAFSQHADVCGKKTSAARLAAFPVSVDADFA